MEILNDINGIHGKSKNGRMSEVRMKPACSFAERPGTANNEAIFISFSDILTNSFILRLTVNTITVNTPLLCNNCLYDVKQRVRFRLESYDLSMLHGLLSALFHWFE